METYDPARAGIILILDKYSYKFGRYFIRQDRLLVDDEHQILDRRGSQ
jgi:hypothetical protein